MAGIGFELRKLMQSDTYTGMLQAYGYAGIISSGPWVLSILGILILGLVTRSFSEGALFISQFQTSVTYLIATSLIASGFLQLSFTRYIADRLFLNDKDCVLPSYHAALLVTTLVSGVFGSLVIAFFMAGQNLVYQFLMIMGFVILSNIWLTTTLLSGLKAYRAILTVFFVAYSSIVALGYVLQSYGLNGLLFAFVMGHWVLLLGMISTLYYHYPLQRLFDFDFLLNKKLYGALIWTGFFYNLGVWSDKFVFWFHPSTGMSIIGPLRASLIYDIPIFLACLSIIPGMAVFLVRMETDFVEYYDKFYTAVRDGGTLSEIRQLRNEMVLVARQGIFEIVKIQALTVLLVFAAGPSLLEFLGISTLYYDLLCIDVVGAGLQVVFLGILNVFFYLDKRRRVITLTSLFAAGNLLLTLISIHMGTFYFGYGFTVALLAVIGLGMFYLDRDFENLEYETFMLQPVTS